jgi:hypothetical protein
LNAEAYNAEWADLYGDPDKKGSKKYGVTGEVNKKPHTRNDPKDATEGPL